MFANIAVASWPFKDFRSVLQIVPNRECRLWLRSCIILHYVFLHCLLSNKHASLGSFGWGMHHMCRTLQLHMWIKLTWLWMLSNKFAHQERSEKRPYKFLGNSRLVPSKQLICQIPTRNSPGRHARAMTPSCACVCVRCVEPQISGVHCFKNYRFWKFPALYQSERTEVQALYTCTCFRADWWIPDHGSKNRFYQSGA